MKRPQIVLLEDDDGIREAIKHALELEGYRVAEFPNGKAALDGMEECKDACLILCDLMMPIMSGSEFLDARKNLGAAIAAIPVFIISAVPEQALSRKDVRGFLKKPFDLDLLCRIVHQHCGPGSK